MRRPFLAVALCGMLFVAGCGGGEEQGGAASAQIEVGAVVPLSGASATIGRRTLQGIELAADVVNEDLPHVNLPLAKSDGLPNIEGARIRVISADNREDPEAGAAATERLIKRGQAVAVVGSYFSSVTRAAAERAERLGIPFVNGDSSAPELTERGRHRFFFRTGPSDRTFAEGFFEFMDDLNSKRSAGIRNVAVLYENTEFGSGVAKVTTDLATREGYRVVAAIPYRNGVHDVSPLVARIKALKPDVLFQASYTPEAILFTKTFRRLNYAPNLLAFGAGYSDAAYFKAVGSAGEYTISRAAWALDAVRNRPAAVRIANMFRLRYGAAMDENSARTFTAAMTLFEAINRAGSTDPKAIRDALAATDISADQTITPWKGVRFNANGQNTLARGVIVQRIDGAYRTVWPFGVGAAKLVWPAPAFSMR